VIDDDPLPVLTEQELVIVEEIEIKKIEIIEIQEKMHQSAEVTRQALQPLSLPTFLPQT